MSQVIFEPAEEFERTYRKLHLDSVNQYFQHLVNTSGIDIEANRKTVKQYVDCTENVSALKKKRNWLRFWRVLMCITLVLIPVVILKMTPRIRQLLEEIETAEQRAGELLGIAQNQMAPLCALFTDRDCLNLVEGTLPLLDFADRFTAEQETDMCVNYDFCKDNTWERSTLDVLAGHFNENPFLFERRLVHTMGTETYHGYKTIHWTESYTDHEGRRQTRSRSETLHATVVKPKPYYHTQVVLHYCAQGGPELSFSRNPGHVEQLSERELERHVKKGAKKLQRLTDRATQEGDDFTAMSNEDFEVLFDATDRDHEVQFRTLFTPLAQTNMVELLRSKAGYGDDFTMIKRRRTNHVITEHSQRRMLVLAAAEYFSYSYDQILKNFVEKNDVFFRDVYFDFAPLWSIPLYQERPVHALKPLPPLSGVHSMRECEALANVANAAYLVHPNTKTAAMIKTIPIRSQDGVDEICVTAYSYDIAQRVDWVSVYGGDGHFHSVAVEWDEYLPLEARQNFRISTTQTQQPIVANRNGLYMYAI